MTPTHGWIFSYLALISGLSVLACLYDKFAATFTNWKRERESTLLLLSLMGGSVAMLITMLIIRHKTRQPKFMVGIPLILFLQSGAILCLHYLR